MRPMIKQVIDKASEKAIRLEKAGINDEELAEIVEYIIQTHPNIEQLGFPNNKLTDNGCAILGEKLAPLVKNHYLTYLNLEYNAIGEKGFTYICNGLMSINPEFSIAFRGNKFQDLNIMYEIHEKVKANKIVTKHNP